MQCHNLMSCPIPPAPNLVVCRQVGEQRRAAILVLNDKLLRASNQTNETLLNHMSHDPCQISNFQMTSWKAENIVHRQYAPGSQWWSTVDILQSFKTLRLFILKFVALSAYLNQYLWEGKYITLRFLFILMCYIYIPSFCQNWPISYLWSPWRIIHLLNKWQENCKTTPSRGKIGER